jgi:hypothetical protein
VKIGERERATMARPIWLDEFRRRVPTRVPAFEAEAKDTQATPIGWRRWVTMITSAAVLNLLGGCYAPKTVVVPIEPRHPATMAPGVDLGAVTLYRFDDQRLDRVENYRLGPPPPGSTSRAQIERMEPARIGSVRRLTRREVILEARIYGHEEVGLTMSRALSHTLRATGIVVSDRFTDGVSTRVSDPATRFAVFGSVDAFWGETMYTSQGGTHHAEVSITVSVRDLARDQEWKGWYRKVAVTPLRGQPAVREVERYSSREIRNLLGEVLADVCADVVNDPDFIATLQRR